MDCTLDAQVVAALVERALAMWIDLGRPQRLLTAKEISPWIGMPVRSIYRAVDSGGFPFTVVRPNSAPRFPWMLVAIYAALGESV